MEEKRQSVALPWQVYALQGFASSTGAAATYCLMIVHAGSWFNLLPGCGGLLICGALYLLAKRRCAPTTPE